jgi:hypothetical protein
MELLIVRDLLVALALGMAILLSVLALKATRR